MKQAAAGGVAHSPATERIDDVFCDAQSLQARRVGDAGVGPMVEVDIADARTHLPRMIRSSADRQGISIGNTKSAASPRAILIGMRVLEPVIQEAARPPASPTAGEILESLPFSEMELRPLRGGTTDR